jgi:SAM-dependent methyltransferase
VFSSSVLEHVREPAALQAEILRVLKTGGRAVHAVPSATWRLWTSLAHYPYLLKAAVLARSGGGDDLVMRKARVARLGPVDRVKKILFPHRHGERGNFVTETFLFSRWSWAPFFRRHGWSVAAVRPLGVFYSGYRVLGPALGLNARHALGRLLGSSSVAYVLERRV